MSKNRRNVWIIIFSLFWLIIDIVLYAVENTLDGLILASVYPPVIVMVYLFLDMITIKK